MRGRFQAKLLKSRWDEKGRRQGARGGRGLGAPANRGPPSSRRGTPAGSAHTCKGGGEKKRYVDGTETDSTSGETRRTVRLRCERGVGGGGREGGAPAQSVVLRDAALAAERAERHVRPLPRLLPDHGRGHLDLVHRLGQHGDGAAVARALAVHHHHALFAHTFGVAFLAFWHVQAAHAAALLLLARVQNVPQLTQVHLLHKRQRSRARLRCGESSK